MTAIASGADFARKAGGGAAALRGASALWYLVAVAGQWIFVAYIASFYWRPTLAGHFAAWNRRDLITGYVPGDHVGNGFFAVHVLVAALITTSGALQLVPAIRKVAPAFHRWNGRFYIATAFVMALGGLWMVWVRGTWLTWWGAASSSILALLIMGCAAMALRHAMAGRIAAHRRWALRTFLVVSGVWFQRIGYMLWILVNQGPVGIGKHMDGPFDIALGFAVFLVPLAILEIYLRVRDRGGDLAKTAMAGALLVLTLATGVGVAGAWMMMWKPYM
ncbi:MAG: DUF2306 domain-containing protein [Caulobacteraceae bacterium]